MGATIASILHNNPDQHFTFHVVVFSIADEHRERLVELNKQTNVSTHVHMIDPDLFSQFDPFIRSSYYSSAIFARLVIPEIVKPYSNTVLYLDADILCVGKLDELRDLEMTNKVVCVVPDVEITMRRRVAALGLAQEKYFNSGILYINNAQWISKKITESAIQVLVERGAKFRFHDQDALNLVLHEYATFIDKKWNYLYSLVDNLKADRRHFSVDQNAVLIHFAGAVKPWATWSLHDAHKLFVRYHTLSNWSDMPLDEVPQNTKELRLQAHFLLKRGQFLRGIYSYGQYLMAKLARS
jgi:lipopolysaccharide biosynthesis glycosyltransferase